MNKIIRFDTKTFEVLAKYETTKEASENGKFSPVLITQCANGSLKTQKGYHWCYENDLEFFIEEYKPNEKKKVVCLKCKKKFISEIDSLGVPYNRICDSCKVTARAVPTCRGFFKGGGTVGFKAD